MTGEFLVFVFVGGVGFATGCFAGIKVWPQIKKRYGW